MAQMIVHIERADLELFKLKVGKGNMSPIIRNYVKNYVGIDNDKEAIIRKKFTLLDEEKAKMDLEWGKLKTKLESIKQKKDIEDLKRMEEKAKEEKNKKDAIFNTMKENLHRVV